MSKRKYKRGKQIKSVAELLKHDWFIVAFAPKVVKTLHAGFVRSWQLQMCERFVKAGSIYVAERLTNGEYYAGKSDDEIQEMLETDLCDLYCPLPDELKGVHCYGGEPVMCEGSHCAEAVETWKQEEVE